MAVSAYVFGQGLAHCVLAQAELPEHGKMAAFTWTQLEFPASR